VLELTIEAERIGQIEEALREGTAIEPPGGRGWSISELVTIAAVAIYRAELSHLLTLSESATASPELREHFMGVALRELEAAVDFTHDDLIREGHFGSCRAKISWSDEDEEPSIERL